MRTQGSLYRLFSAYPLETSYSALWIVRHIKLYKSLHVFHLDQIADEAMAGNIVSPTSGQVRREPSWRRFHGTEILQDLWREVKGPLASSGVRPCSSSGKNGQSDIVGDTFPQRVSVETPGKQVRQLVNMGAFAPCIAPTYTLGLRKITACGSLGCWYPFQIFEADLQA